VIYQPALLGRLVGPPEATEARNAEVHDDGMNDYDAVVMAVLEPILVLSVMAVLLFWCGYPGKGMGQRRVRNITI
jgi:hypothetical protein